VTPDVVVDVGNSRVKWGRVAGGGIAEMVALGLDDVVGWKRQADAWSLPAGGRWAVASVNPPAADRLAGWLADRGDGVTAVTHAALGSHGFRTAVRQPGKVGIDRLLTALAAWRRAGRPVVAVSVGTALTGDLVSPDGVHVGGIILPGPHLMARSLHQHTAALPLIEPPTERPEQGWGTDTRSAIAVGIAAAVLGAVDELVSNWADQHDRPSVVVTGGGAELFNGWVFTATGCEPDIVPHLTLDGVRLTAEGLP
jgi:type III pantothenate kinase